MLAVRKTSLDFHPFFNPIKEEKIIPAPSLAGLVHYSMFLSCKRKDRLAEPKCKRKGLICMYGAYMWVLGAWEACLPLPMSVVVYQRSLCHCTASSIIVITCSSYAAVASNVKKWTAVPDVDSSLERNRPAINVHNLFQECTMLAYMRQNIYTFCNVLSSSLYST